MWIVAPAVGTPGGNFGAVVVGTGNVWSDGSDATYVYLPPGNSPNPGWGRAPCPLPRIVPDSPGLKVYARIKIDNQVPGHAPGIILNIPSSGSVGEDDPTQLPRHEAGGITWIPLTLSDRTWFDPSMDPTCDILVTYESFESSYAWNVYEAALVFITPSDAPPCRNIKRGDRLDLGGARNYPTSKMTNTSSRGVGAY